MFFFFQAEDGIRDLTVTGVQTCALPISLLFSLGGGGEAGTRAGAVTLRWYRQLWDNPLLVGGVQNSLLVGALVGLITPPLALLAARAGRQAPRPRPIVAAVLLALVLPGLS